MPDGHAALTPMKQSIDTMTDKVAPRSLLTYALLDGGARHVLAPLLMRANGFSLMRCSGLAYWYRPGRSSKPPLLFLHGIGIGVLPYVLSGCVGSLVKADIELIIPEFPEVSLSLMHTVRTSFGYRVLAKDRQAALLAILDRHALSCVDVVGHSYGSIIAAWLIKACPVRIRRTTLIDPVCLLLSRATVCYNFLYAKRTGLINILTGFFVCQEAGLVSTLMRNFTWFENTLFFQELAATGHPASVFLADADAYVDSYSVAEAIAKYNETQRGESPPIKVHNEPGAVHGAFLAPAYDDLHRRIISAILEN
jgi:pimeloyl-ACP methyl ester carboxylesterase